MTDPHTPPSTRWFATLRRWAGRVCGSASADLRQLRAMSDHELNDLGIGRSEIQAWSRRRAPTERRGTLERAPLERRAVAPWGSARLLAEHGAHDRLEGLRFGLYTGGKHGLRGGHASPFAHTVVAVKGRALTKA